MDLFGEPRDAFGKGHHAGKELEHRESGRQAEYRHERGFRSGLLRPRQRDGLFPCRGRGRWFPPKKWAHALVILLFGPGRGGEVTMRRGQGRGARGAGRGAPDQPVFAKGAREG
jgi:hypothetical protein